MSSTVSGNSATQDVATDRDWSAECLPAPGVGATWPYRDLNIDRRRYGTPERPLTPDVPHDGFLTPFVRETYLGAGHRGGMQSGFFLGQVRGAPATNQTNWNYTALQTLMSATAPVGGAAVTMGLAKGQIFGFSSLGVLYPGAKNFLNLTGGEINVQVSHDASVAYKSGLQIVATPDDAVQGAIFDAALSISNQPGAVGYRIGILLSAANGKAPVAAGGTILKVQDGPILAHGVDLTNVNFHTDAFASRGFSVDGVGRVSSTLQRLAPTTFTRLPRCTDEAAGTIAYIADAAVPVIAWHQIVRHGGGNNRTFLSCSGSDWLAF